MKKLVRFLMMVLCTPLAIVWFVLWAFFTWLAVDDDFNEELAELKHTRYFQWLTFK